MELELGRNKDVSVSCAVAAKERPGKTAQLLVANDSDKSVPGELIAELDAQLKEARARKNTWRKSLRSRH